MNSSPAAVAIITPYFNTGTIFAETIASVFAQTLQQWEWVVVDDGSTDTAALDALRALDDPRIKLIVQPNHGLPAARNAGVAVSTAPLLFFLDSDDLLRPTALEQLAWLLHSDVRPAFATSWVEIFGAEQLEWRRGFDSRRHFLWDNQATPATMVRRAVFEAVGGFDEARIGGLEDYEFWLRCAAHGFWGRDLPEVLIRIRRKAAREYAHYAWPTRDDPQRYAAFRAEMRARFPQLYRNGLPQLPPTDERPFAPVVTTLPFENVLIPQGTRRLLLLLPNLDYGGVSSFALYMLRQLTARGYYCFVATTLPGQHPLLDVFRRYAEVFVLEHFLLRPDYPRFLHYLIQSRRVDAVLLSNSTMGYRLLPWLRSRCPHVALLDYNHMPDADVINGGSAGFGAEYDELLDMHLVSSEALREWMLARGADAARTHIVYTAINSDHWRPDPVLRAQVRAELGLGDMPLLIYPARLTAQKQPLVFARVVAELARRGYAFACVVAGDGPEAAALQSFLKQHGLLPRVYLLGAVDAERVRALLAAADIMFLPSAYEGLALVLYEAMACGVVPVTVRSGGHAELVTPDCGVLVAPGVGQEERYIAVLEWLLRAPQQHEAMARQARRRVVEHFDAEQMGARLERLIGEACRLAVRVPRPSVSSGAGIVAASLAVEELRLYQRNRQFRPLVVAWDWWKRHGAGYAARAARAARARERLLLRLYPLRQALRPWWHWIRRIPSPKTYR